METAYLWSKERAGFKYDEVGVRQTKDITIRRKKDMYVY